MAHRLDFHPLSGCDSQSLVLSLGDPLVTEPSNLPFHDFRAAEIFVKARLAEQARGHCEPYVLRLDTAVVGYAALYLRAKEAEPVFAITPSLWGAGIGGLALEFLIERAEQDTASDRLVATCRKDNRRAVSLLRSKRFAPAPGQHIGHLTHVRPCRLSEVAEP